MRALSFLVALAFVALSGCDATAPSASADASLASFFIVGPSFVMAGDCDTFTIEDNQGNPQTGSGWAVQYDGYLTHSGPSSAFVLATGPTVGKYKLSVTVQGTAISKTVRVRTNPQGTVAC